MIDYIHYKMFILARYILKEHIWPFFFGIFIICFVFILNIIFRDLGRLLSRGIEVKVVLEFLFLNMAWIIALAVPMAVLVSTLMAFGRLSSDNEITAIKASGISLYQILTPTLIASAILAWALVEFNNRVLPEFNHRARLLTYDIFRKKPTLKLEPNVVFRDLPGYNLMVRKVREEGDSSRVAEVIIDDKTDPDINRTIIAKRGIVKLDEAREMLVITLFDGGVHEINLRHLESYRKTSFKKSRVCIPVPGMVLKRSSSSYRGDREKSASMMLAEIRDIRGEIQKRYERINRMVTTYMKSYFRPALLKRTEFDVEIRENLLKSKITQWEVLKALRATETIYRQVKAEMRIVNTYKRAINALMVEVHKKYSIPLACLVFILVGAPLGIMIRRGGMATSGGISLGFFLLYWAFLIGGEELADRGLLTPFLAMWLPNILVGIGGIYLVVRTVRESTFIKWEAFIPKKWRRG